ncbi:cyclophilin-like fold protein [uncultured Brachyspira sp.]|uniref:cyclophilin-like fold protein n=1 Tax=uncultured Brachyspira sp. TaxID=221953 RepID=UPI002618B65F|nr:cyclophilin-like fold protein [uncultured Brachyspira sp.]
MFKKIKFIMIISLFIFSLCNAQNNNGKKIKITVNNQVLDAIIYNTELANEIINTLPITVSMIGYGNREYYGQLSYTPKNITKGQLNFQNGDITYCARNNSLAIFYSQSDNPNLTMEVIPIGKITSDLKVFHNLYNNGQRRVNITFSL